MNDDGAKGCSTSSNELDMAMKKIGGYPEENSKNAKQWTCGRRIR
jgi:hypothetical protein